MQVGGSHCSLSEPRQRVVDRHESINGIRDTPQHPKCRRGQLWSMRCKAFYDIGRAHKRRQDQVSQGETSL